MDILLGGLFSVLGTVFICIMFYAGFGNLAKQTKEKKLYKKMIANPCDQTVLLYIPAFKSTYGFTSGIYFAKFGVQHRNDQQRQAQGYEIIKSSTNVSQTVKEQLKNAFVMNGVPIKL